MNRILFLTIIILFSKLSWAQNVESALLHLNGPKAIYEIKMGEDHDPNFLSLAWHLIGNDRQQLEYARKWVNSATSDKQKAIANLHFTQRNWKGVIHEYQKITGKSKLDLYRLIVAINQSSEKTEHKKKMITTLINDNQLDGLPAFQLQLAEALINEKEFGKAAEILYNLKSSAFPYIRIHAHQKLARSQLLKGDTNAAFSTSEEALKSNEGIKNKNGQAYCLYLMSLIKARQGAFEEGKELAEQGAFIGSESGNLTIEYNLNNIKSWTYFATDEDFNLILAQEARQVQLVKLLNDSLKKADVYNNLGYDLTVAGRVHLDSAIHLMEYANNTYAKNEGHQGRWYTLMNLAWQYRLKEDYEKSASYADLSMKQALDIEDRHAIIEAAFQYGETLLAQGNIGQAKTYYQLGLKWRGDVEDRDSYVFDVYYANYLWSTGKKNEAIKRLEIAVNFLATSEVLYEMHGRALLAKYYFELRQFDQAWEQIKVVENPRSNYVSLESKTIAVNIKAKLLTRSNDKETSDNIIYSFYTRTDLIGASQLLKMLQE